MRPAFGGMEGSGASRGCVRWPTTHSLGQDPTLGGHSGAETKGIEVEAVERLGPQSCRVCAWISEASGSSALDRTCLVSVPSQQRVGWLHALSVCGGWGGLIRLVPLHIPIPRTVQALRQHPVSARGGEAEPIRVQVLGVEWGGRQACSPSSEGREPTSIPVYWIQAWGALVSAGSVSVSVYVCACRQRGVWV